MSHSKSTALITGGSRGIGRAIARCLARRGIADTLLLNYNQDDSAAESAKAEVEDTGASCRLYRCNLAFPSEISEMFARITEDVGRIDILVHAAALGAFKPLTAIKPNQWDLSMAVNARSLLQCTQLCLPIMSKGHIVAISSLGSRRAIPNYGVIGASKAALESMVRQLALELGPEGIHINGVAGGFIDTDSIRKFPNYKLMVEHAIKNTPSSRIGIPDDIADIVAFLVGDDARWIQGQVIVADGGFSLT